MVSGKSENEISRTSWNGLHILPVAISGKTLKAFTVFELRHQKWSGYGLQHKKNFWIYLATWKVACN